MRRSQLLSLLTLGGLFIPSFPARSAEKDDPAIPRVVAVWASGPFEVRIAFDRTLRFDSARAVLGATIAFDGTRTIVGSLPSASSAATETAGSLKVVAAKFLPDCRTLILTTDPHPRAGVYTFDLPIEKSGKSVKVAYDLSGLEVTWRSDNKEPGLAWKSWWPEPDPVEVNKQLRESTTHLSDLLDLDTKGKLTLDTFLVLPPGRSTLTISADGPIEATLNGETPLISKGAAVFETESTGAPIWLNVTIETGMNHGLPRLNVTGKTPTSPAKPLIHKRFLLPWVPSSPPTPPPLENVFDLSGGDSRKGAIIFAGNDAKCASCHKVRGEGGNVGPDLSGLVGRDRKEVYRDIAEPSVRINPDYVPYTVALKDGRIVVGTVRAEGADAIRVSDSEAKTTVVRRDEIDEFRPVATSVMPVGLAAAIGEEKLRDLIAYLTSPPPK